MNFCTKCGEPLNPGDKVCTNCGAAVRPSMQSAGQVRRSQGGTPSGPQKKSGVNPVVIIVLILIAAIAVGAAVILTNRNKNNSAAKEDDTKVKVVESSEGSAAASSGSAASSATSAAAAAAKTQTPTPEPKETPISETPYYVTGVASEIHLYEKPEQNSLLAGDLKNGAVVRLLDQKDEMFWKVLTDKDVAGYIDRHYLTDEKTAVTDPKTVYVSGVKNTLTLYKQPNDMGESYGKLQEGDKATLLAKTKGEFWYAYVDSLKQYGYLKNKYLSEIKPAAKVVTATPTATPTPTPPAETPTPAPEQAEPYFGAGPAPSSYSTFYASVDSGYLALRNAKAFDASNELGKIMNGEPVFVTQTPNEQYWYVYAPTLGMWGYVNSDYLTTSGGSNPAPSPSTTRLSVKVDSGYLALRSAPAFDASNEIGKLYTGDVVDATSDWSGDYVWVYSPKYNAWGYVNGGYLTNGSVNPAPVSADVYKVKVDSGYLALRNAKAFDSSNEIGKLYTGDKVEVQSKESGDYWWVYAPSLGQSGYVNKNYLIK